MVSVILISSAAVLAIVLGFLAWYIRSLFQGPDYSRLPVHYPFKSAAARERYYAYYNARARAWPVPSETQTIETAFGRTFVRTCGREGDPPLVLLPSVSASSLIWLPNIQGLASHFRIHAVDNIYDVGLSVNTRSVADAGHLTAWLDELLAKLEPSGRVNLTGLSFGGWLAGQYALRHPDRLQRVVLAAPVATLFPLPGAWAWRAIMGALPPHRFFMTHFLVNWMCRDLAGKGDEPSRQLLDHWVNDALMAMRCFKFRMPITPTVLSDDELRSLRVPTLFVIGEHEVVYPAGRAVQRLKTVAPAVATVVLQNAGHDLTISQTQEFNTRVLSFLMGPQPTR